MSAPDFAVVGDPIAHSLSPVIHTAAYRELGLELRYEAIRVSVAEFPSALEQLGSMGVRGVNVTVPHKEAARRWCQAIDGSDYGAINTLDLQSRRGTNTDAPALTATMHEFGIKPPARVLVLGAGGTARTAIQTLHEQGFELAVWNRTSSRLASLQSELAIPFEIAESPAWSGANAIINATSASLTGDELPIDWSGFAPGTLAYELAYGPHLSDFLAGAINHDLRAVDGKAMLVEQAALAFEWWLGIPAPRRAMLNAIGL